jgi:hypothetical protein
MEVLASRSASGKNPAPGGIPLAQKQAFWRHFINRSLFSRVTAAAATLALVLSVVPAAANAPDAQPAKKPLKLRPLSLHVRFHNLSNRCARLTPYWGYGNEKSTMFAIFPSGPRMVKAGMWTEV